MYFVVLVLSSAGFVCILNSSQAAAEEKILEEIVKEARARAKVADTTAVVEREE